MFQPRNFYKVQLTGTSFPGRIARKITKKMLASFGFLLKFESFKSVNTVSAVNVQNWEAFSVSQGKRTIP